MGIKTLNMRNADGYATTEFDIVKQALIDENKYREDLLYRGFDGKNIPRLLKTGQDTEEEYLYCVTEKQIGDLALDDNANIFRYACDHNNPAIAVFNPAFFEEFIRFAYRFKNPDKKKEALVSVFKLHY